MERNKARLAFVMGRGYFLDQRRVVGGALRDAGFVFTLANRTDHKGLPLNFRISTWSNHFASNGISSKCVIRLKARKRSLISACVRRRTRSVPNSSTLNEAITDPKIIA